MKKILFIINVDWFFESHFLPLATKALEKGYEVHLACGFTDRESGLKKLGIITYPLSITRSGTSLWHELRVMKEIYDVMRTVEADVVEFFTIKPVLYGGIVSHFLKIPKRVFYITGLGYTFIQKGFKGSVVKTMVKNLYRLALVGNNSSVITENSYDKALIESLHIIDSDRIYIIKGAGVDFDKYPFVDRVPNNPFVVVMASRLLKDKGVFEYVAAAKTILQEGYAVKFLLYGDIDIYNPTSLTTQDLHTIKKEGNVEVKGFCNDIAQAFVMADIVVLPSYREGLPKVLVEAAACARAVVTTDVPGCRDVIVPKKTGVLCKAKDAHSLAEAIKKLLDDSNLCRQMGLEARKLAQKEYDIRMILKQHFHIYGEKI